MSGEVRYPGRYIIKRNERLSSLIERAGGYSDDAYLRGAFFTRARVKDSNRRPLMKWVARMERELLAEGPQSKKPLRKGSRPDRLNCSSGRNFLKH